MRRRVRDVGRAGSGEQRSLRVRLPAEGLDLSLTDPRFYTNEFQDPEMERVAPSRRALVEGSGVLLGVRLTRPFATAEGETERHWLQVNALHLRGKASIRVGGRGG
jgi:hypothetical protein